MFARVICIVKSEIHAQRLSMGSYLPIVTLTISKSKFEKEYINITKCELLHVYDSVEDFKTPYAATIKNRTLIPTKVNIEGEVTLLNFPVFLFDEKYCVEINAYDVGFLDYRETVNIRKKQ